MRTNNLLQMTLSNTPTFTMSTAVQPTLNSGKNSASAMTAPSPPPTAISQSLSPTSRGYAAGVCCMADNTADNYHTPSSQERRRREERRGWGDKDEKGGRGVGVSSQQKTTALVRV